MNTILFVGLAVALGAVPLVLYTLLLWWFDRYEREPWPLLLAAFLWGTLPAALLSLVVGLALDLPLRWLLGSDGLAYPLASTGLAAPLVEEAMKGAGVVLLVLVFRREIDSLFDGLLYGAVIGYGAAVVAHASHNTGLTLVELSPLGLGFTLVADGLGLAFVLVLFAVARWREGAVVAQFLQDEVERGTLTAGELDLVSSVLGRELARWQLLLNGDLHGWRRMGKFQHACAELAFGKRRLLRDGEPTAVDLHGLREAVAGLKPAS